MKNPLALAFVWAWAAAAAAATWLPDGGAIWPWVASLLLGALLCSRRNLSLAALLCAALALAGALAWKATRVGERFQQELACPLPAGEVVTLRGVLIEFPVIEAESTRLVLQTETISAASGTALRRLRLAVRVPGTVDHLDRGDRLEVAASFPAPRSFSNFAPDPFENARKVSGVHFAGYVKDRRLIERTHRAPLPWRVIGAWRRAIRGQIAARYPRAGGGTDSAGVFLLATVIGDRGELDPGLRRQLIRAGAYHLIAISGANVAMLAALSLWFWGRLKVRRRGRLVLTGLLLVCFLALSGFDPSAQRAVLMALVFFAALGLSREIHPFNLLGFAGLFILTLAPLEAIDPGFALTFALTAAILWGRRRFLPWFHRLPGWGGEFLAASLAALLASFPLSLFFFRRFSVIGVLAGFVLIPLAGLVTVVGTLVMLLAPWFPTASSLVLLVARPLLRGFLAAVAWFAGPLHLSVFRPPPPLAWVVVFFALFALFAWLREGWLRKGAILALLGVTAWLLLSANRYAPDRLELVCLDVGQGEALVVVFPGGDALLVDGGGNPRSRLETGSRLVFPFLVDQGIRVRWLAASHFHPDHVAGLIELLPDLVPEEVWIGARLPGDPLYEEFLAALPAATRLREVARGFCREVAGVTVEVLAPPRVAGGNRGENADSLVIKVSDRDQRFLLTGDITAAQEGELCRENPASLSATVLKLSHHGSRGSSSEPFLDRVAPGLAVVSAGQANPYGFPHPEVLARLAKRTIPLLVTARSGAVRIVSRPGDPLIETSR